MRFTGARILRRVSAASAFVAAMAFAPAAAPAAVAPPSDPQWGQAQFGQLNVMAGLNALDHPLASTAVASIDTGVDLQHPDMAPRLFGFPAATATVDGNVVAAGAPGWNFLGPGCFLNAGAEEPNSNPDDPLGCGTHGTMVSSMMGAQWSNGTGGAGIAPNARVMAIKSCWENDQCWDHTVPAGIHLAVAGGARVVTFSFVGTGDTATVNALIAGSPQTLFIPIPSGNGGAFDTGTGVYPCNAPYGNVLCVTTAGPGDGPSCGAYNPTIVDIAVPTEGGTVAVNGGSYAPTGCATSFASPAAGGIASILFGEYPNATGAQVRDAIVNGDRDVAAWAGKTVSGGVPNLAGALAALDAVRPPGENTGGGPGPGPGGTLEPFPLQPPLPPAPLPKKKPCKKVKPKAKGKKPRKKAKCLKKKRKKRVAKKR